MLRTVSLFSGCGGLDYAFQSKGFDLVFAADNDPKAIEVYRRNVDERAYVYDVVSAEFHEAIKKIGQCDVVLGGFPCQGFSKAGPKRVDDERNALYQEMKRAVAVLKPTIFIAENVDGLHQNFGGHYLKSIIDDFADLGYSVEFKILDAAAFGVPQHRRRIIFVGTKFESHHSFHWPQPTHAAKSRNGEFSIVNDALSLWDTENTASVLAPPVTMHDAISDLVTLGGVSDHAVIKKWPEKYEHVFRAIGPGQKLCNVRHAATAVYTWNIPEAFGYVTVRQKKILETIGLNRRHKQYGDIPNGNPLTLEVIQELSGLSEIHCDEIDDLLTKNYIKEVAGKYDLKGAMFNSGLFKRPDWNEPSPTVLTIFDNPRYFLHPSENRPLSLRECARLQSFPDSFTFSQGDEASLKAGYRLVGNAVPPLLGQHLAISVKNYVEQSKGKVTQ